MKDIRKIKEMSEINAVISENPDKLVIVKVSGTWCGPCQVLKKTINDLPDKDLNDVIILDADVDEAEEVGVELGVRSIPAMFFYKGSRDNEVDKTVGLLTREALIEKIKENSK